MALTGVRKKPIPTLTGDSETCQDFSGGRTCRCGGNSKTTTSGAEDGAERLHLMIKPEWMRSCFPGMNKERFLKSEVTSGNDAVKTI